MSKRLAIVCGLILGLMIAGILAGLLRPHEPAYEGRSLSGWAQMLGESKVFLQPPHDRAPKAEAADAIRHIGTNAIPYLLELLRYEERPRWRAKLGKELEKLPSRLQSQRVEKWLIFDTDRAWGAIGAFGILGPEAKGAIPELTRMLNIPKTGSWAALALGKVGPEALPPLIAALTNQDKDVRSLSADAICEMGTNARPAVPALEQAVHDPVFVVRQAAGTALRRMDPEAWRKAVGP